LTFELLGLLKRLSPFSTEPFNYQNEDPCLQWPHSYSDHYLHRENRTTLIEMKDKERQKLTTVP